MDEFSIPIPNSELKEGIRLSIENAERLVEDAEILYDNNRHMSASYLSITALEEEGKANILLKRLLDGKDVTKEDWEENMKDHQRKIIAVQETISNFREVSRIVKHGQKRRVDPANFAKFLLKSKDGYIYVDWDFETRRTQVNDKWESPSKDIQIEGFSLENDKTNFPLVSNNTRREVAQNLIYEAKIGLESTRMAIKGLLKNQDQNRL